VKIPIKEKSWFFTKNSNTTLLAKLSNLILATTNIYNYPVVQFY
jgi:hypothetical protein